MNQTTLHIRDIKKLSGSIDKNRPLKKRIQAFLIRNIAFSLIYLLRLTIRFKFVDMDVRKRAEDSNPAKSFIIASWHEHCMAGIMAHSWQNICLLVSQSFDGEIISSVAGRIGLPAIRGSSSRGGKAALRQLSNVVEGGWRVAFTVDGPRGPRHEVKAGAASLARVTGVPVLPIMAIADRSWVFSKSWDQFRFPKPFSVVKIHYAEPVFISRDADSDEMEAKMAEIKESLLKLHKEFLPDGH